MPSSFDSKDVLYYSAKEIINFSDNWKSLYHPFTWPNSTTAEEIKPSEKIEQYSSKINIECEARRSCVPYSECFITSNFIPNNHSTPNTKQNPKKESARNYTYESSVEAMSFSTTYPDTSISTDHQNISAQIPADINDSIESVNPVPSISRDIDNNSRNKYICNEIYCERNRDRRVRKTGIKGVRCIVSFALTDDPVKKRTQIQACSISVMILAIVSISVVLVYFTSNRYNIGNVPVPTLPSNSSTDSLRTTSTGQLPAARLQPLTQRATSTPPPAPTTASQLLNDAPAPPSDRNTTITQIIQKIQSNLKPYPKFPRRSEPSKETARNESANVTENRDATEKFCRKCQNDTQVCMLNEESGIPVCINAVDRHDPTGCGGLCAMDTEACQLVDRVHGVHVCRALSVRCSADQWRCYNGLCVPKKSRCDGRVNCYDRSDELHCECDLSKNFRCGHSTSCFPNSKLCDGTVDCWDGRDEINCTNSCPDEEFTCNNGQCISSSRFCDGLADCTDNSDEPSGCDGACAANEMRCANHRCVLRTVKCDGIDNCGDRTDEISCSL